MSKHFWLLVRALLGLLLTLLFYGLALGIVVGLLGLIYLMVAHAGRVNFKVVAFCISGAGAILWSLVPRRQQFEAPGLEVFPEDQPKLYRVIEEIAYATGQRMPDEVYLNGEVNAAVSERGGFLGFGRKRMLILGLPLMQGLSDIEMRGVIAHEFGHYCGGDTFLGPWIHASYYSLARTIKNLDESWLRHPFYLYAKLYSLVTGAVAKQQEYKADAVAVAVAGPDASKSFLYKLTPIALTYDYYLGGVLQEPLGAGFRLPVMDGFSRLLKSETYKTSKKAILDFERTHKSSWFDTHPSTAERVAAITELNAPTVDGSFQSSIRWLQNLDRIESNIIFTPEFAGEYTKRPTTDWDDLMDAYYIPKYRWMIDSFKQTVGKHKVEEIPLLFARPKEYIHDLMKFHEVEKKDFEAFVEKLKGEWDEIMISPIASAFALALLEAGWQMFKKIGDSAQFVSPENQEIICTPNKLVYSLFITMRGDKEIPESLEKLTPDDWQVRMTALGIADLPLALAWDIPLKTDRTHQGTDSDTYDLLGE